MQINKIWKTIWKAALVIGLALPIQACSTHFQNEVDAVLDSMIYPSDDEIGANPNIHVRWYWARIWWVRAWDKVYRWDELDEIDINVEVNIDLDGASVEIYAE